ASSTSLLESATEWAASARSAADPVISPAASFAAATIRLATKAMSRLRRLPGLLLARRAAAGCRSPRRGGRLTSPTDPRLLDAVRPRQGTDLLGQLEDLLGEVDQLDVLPVLQLHGLPGVVGDHLALRVGAVLGDHHEGREEDRLERDDHRQQT